MRDIEWMSKLLNGRSPALFDAVKLEKITKPKVLDLFCGAGGATKGYQNLGYYVVGVDHKWQPNYCGDMFIQAEALSWLQDNIEFVKEQFVAVHASPPCQAYTTGVDPYIRNNYPKLVEPTRDALIDADIHYIIENVAGYYTGLIDPIMLCGSTFGLRVRRHRLFETDFPVKQPECDHKWQDDSPVFITYHQYRWSWRGTVGVHSNGGSTGNAKAYWPWAMGMGDTWDDCWMTPYELTQAIPPAYTQYVGSYIPEYARR